MTISHAMGKEKIKCSDCDQLFRDRFNMWRHYMRKHFSPKVKDDKAKSEKPKPTCSVCGQVFYKNGNLKRHSKLCKKTKVTLSEDHNFNSLIEFEDWKRTIEIQTKSRYVKKSSYKLQNGSLRTKYCCHRSGFFKPQGKNLRRLKVIGSNKINAICPAKIITIVSPSGIIQASYFSKHSGHSLELQRLTLSKTERAEIAEKIAKKIPFKDILRDAKKFSNDPKSKRLQLLTKKDLHNIEKEFRRNTSVVVNPYEELAVDVFLDGPSNVLGTAADSVRLLDKPGTNLDLLPLEHAGSILVPDPGPSSELVQAPQLGLDHHVVSSLDNATFFVEVPYSVESGQEDLASQRDKAIIEKLKEEMRTEFEMVLSSIQNQEQALNAKKWIYSFNSFVHATHFPLQVVIANEHS